MGTSAKSGLRNVRSCSYLNLGSLFAGVEIGMNPNIRSGYRFDSSDMVRGRGRQRMPPDRMVDILIVGMQRSVAMHVEVEEELGGLWYKQAHMAPSSWLGCHIDGHLGPDEAPECYYPMIAISVSCQQLGDR